jgi:hypothetical protein
LFDIRGLAKTASVASDCASRYGPQLLKPWGMTNYDFA